MFVEGGYLYSSLSLPTIKSSMLLDKTLYDNFKMMPRVWESYGQDKISSKISPLCLNNPLKKFVSSFVNPIPEIFLPCLFEKLSFR